MFIAGFYLHTHSCIQYRVLLKHIEFHIQYKVLHTCVVWGFIYITYIQYRFLLTHVGFHIQYQILLTCVEWGFTCIHRYSKGFYHILMLILRLLKNGIPPPRIYFDVMSFELYKHSVKMRLLLVLHNSQWKMILLYFKHIFFLDRR
jgi:hypothetical protein